MKCTIAGAIKCINQVRSIRLMFPPAGMDTSRQPLLNKVFTPGWHWSALPRWSNRGVHRGFDCTKTINTITLKINPRCYFESICLLAHFGEGAISVAYPGQLDGSVPRSAERFFHWSIFLQQCRIKRDQFVSYWHCDMRAGCTWTGLAPLLQAANTGFLSGGCRLVLKRWKLYTYFYIQPYRVLPSGIALRRVVHRGVK